MTLPHRKGSTTFHHIVVQATGKLFDEFGGTYQFGRSQHLLFGDVGIAQGDVLVNAAGEQEYILQYHTDMLSERGQFKVLNVGSVNGDGALVDFIKS